VHCFFEAERLLLAKEPALGGFDLLNAVPSSAFECLRVPSWVYVFREASPVIAPPTLAPVSQLALDRDRVPEDPEGKVV
jgi:hypothetical protein